MSKDIDKDLDKIIKKKKNKNSIFLNILLVITLFIGLFYFIMNIDNNINNFINNFILVLFTITFVIIGFRSNIKKSGIIVLSSLLLMGFYGYNLVNKNINSVSNEKLINLSGMKIDKVIDWSTKNNVELDYIYEYSDIVPVNYVISQDIDSNTPIEEVKKVKISISDGANPEKLVVIPDMSSWTDEQVINFVEENFLRNVSVEFVQSDEKENTVIEQSTKGTIKRSDELKITFSYGLELSYDEINLKDLVGMSKFRTMFYLKQNHINYEFDEGTSSKYDKDTVMKVSVDPGTKIKINSDPIKITISRGKEIKMIDVKNKTINEVTKWIVSNRLKIKIEDQYDDSIDKNHIIKADKNKDDVLVSGDTVTIYVSLGKLKMEKFDNINDFYSWASKYDIEYVVESQFSDSVDAGQVISYSVKSGDTIKNGDIITVTVSLGKKIKMIDVTNMTKNKATKELKNAGIKYNITYRSSDTVEEDVVISQSIRAGSEIDSNTTVTIVVSSGKAKTESRNNNTGNNNNNNSSGNNGNNSSSNNNSSTTNPTTPSTPTATCTPGTVTVGGELNNIFSNPESYNSVYSQLSAYFNKSQFDNVTIKIIGDSTSGATPGSFISGIMPGDVLETCTGKTYTITIAK